MAKGIERDYELKVIISGKRQVVTWQGTSGENACLRYADANRSHTVIAWRELSVGIYPAIASQIIG